jgi:hypothetical protein
MKPLTSHCTDVTDVCMDEGAISSSALVSMLLDGSVVKEWCRHTGLSISSGLGCIYGLASNQMHDKADVIDRSRRKLEGIIQVLEVLEAPLLQHSYSHTLSELQQLLEFMRKVVQVQCAVATSLTSQVAWSSLQHA